MPWPVQDYRRTYSHFPSGPRHELSIISIFQFLFINESMFLFVLTKPNIQKFTLLIVTSRDYIFYFSQWYAKVLLIFAPSSRREGARQGCGAYERDR